MTVEEKVKQLLNMAEQETDDALRLFKESKHGKPMEGHWSDTARDYSLPILAGLTAYIKSTTRSAPKGE